MNIEKERQFTAFRVIRFSLVIAIVYTIMFAFVQVIFPDVPSVVVAFTAAFLFGLLMTIVSFGGLPRG